MFKKIIEKIKFKFKDLGNQESTFESNVEMPSNELSIDKTVDHEEKVVVTTAEFEKVDLNIVDTYCIKPGRLSDSHRAKILALAYGKDKLPLIKILIRTRKPRIKKKLVKRISK